MATKLTGMLKLSKIEKYLVQTNEKGEKYIWVDILENINGADQYGCTHTIQLWDPAKRERIFLANLKPKQFGPDLSKPAPATQQDAPATEDLPAEDTGLPF